MRRILITPQIEDLARHYAKRLEDGDDFAKGNTPKDKLKKLASVLGKSSTKITILKNKAVHFELPFAFSCRYRVLCYGHSRIYPCT